MRAATAQPYRPGDAVALAALNTAFTVAVATSLSIATPNTGLPSARVHSR